MSDNSVDLPVLASTDGCVTYRLHEPNRIPGDQHAAAPRTLFDGVEEAASKALAVRSHCHRSALHELGSRSTIRPGTVEAVHNEIARNLRSAQLRKVESRSKENWRWCEPQPQIAVHNPSREVKLERAIAAACAGAGRHDWANQVPVASGVVGSSADRRRAIDLVHQIGPGHFQFIELKIASDTPLYAAIEIIGYGCAWLLFREGGGSEASPLLSAEKLDLIVLAPSAYYAPYRLNMIEAALNAELIELGNRSDVCLRFRFEELPDELAQASLPPHNELLELLDRRRQL